jgi:O-antigen/teichoic acid export membrane protein
VTLRKHLILLRPIWKDSAWSLLCRYVATGLTFIMSIMLARLLGADGRGTFSLVQAALDAALLLCGLGVPKILLNLSIHAKLDRNLGAPLLVLMGLAFLSSLLFSGFLALWKPEWGTLLIIASAALLWSRLSLNIVDTRERSGQRLWVYNLTMLSERVLALCGLGVLYFYGSGVLGVTTILFLSVTLTLILYLWFKPVLWRKPGRRLVGYIKKRVYQQGFANVGLGIMVLLFLKSDIFLLGWKQGEAAVGYYSVAMTLLGLAFTVQMSLAFVMVPRFIRLMGQESGHAENAVFIMAGAAVSALTLLGIVAGGYFFLVPLYGEEFTSSVPLLFWFAPFMFFASLRTLIMTKPFAEQQNRWLFWRHAEALIFKGVLLLFIPITAENLAIASCAAAVLLCCRLSIGLRAQHKKNIGSI